MVNLFITTLQNKINIYDSKNLLLVKLSTEKLYKNVKKIGI